MSAISIIQNISAYQLCAAYQPILFRCYSASVNPVVYCDIYFNSVYYRTISSSAIVSGPNQGTSYTWQFDIQTAAQEFLKSTPAYQAYQGIYNDTGCMTYCFIRVRGSSISSGLITPDGTVPIQGTFTSQPVSGSGTQSVEFIILNSALQQEDRPDLAYHIEPIPLGAGYHQHDANFKINALTHAPEFHVTVDDYGHIPVLTGHNGLNGLNKFTFAMVIFASNGSVYAIATTPPMLHDSVYYLPLAPASLNLYKAAQNATIPFQSFDYYTVVLLNGFIPAFQSQRVYVKKGICEHKRIRFLNYLGGFDSVNFTENDEVMKTTSDRGIRPVTTLPYSGSKNNFSAVRINVNSNEECTATGHFQENKMRWLKELSDAPVAFLEWPGEQTQGPQLIPIVVSDVDFQSLKDDERYDYEVSIKYTPSNSNIRQRN